MNWNDILHEVATLKCAEAPVEVAGVQYDSRGVRSGGLFVAMRGGSADGNRFIEAAISQGATAVLTDSSEAYEKLRREHANLGAALVEHGRRALAEASSALFGHP